MEYLMITNFIKFTCRDIESYVFKIPAREILPLYYVAVRGRDSEEGAVQRVLSTKRISDISEYVLKGNAFVNTFILNWANPNASITIQYTNKKHINTVTRIKSDCIYIIGKLILLAFKKIAEHELEKQLNLSDKLSTIYKMLKLALERKKSQN